MGLVSFSELENNQTFIADQYDSHLETCPSFVKTREMIFGRRATGDIMNDRSPFNVARVNDPKPVK